jgi:hypothetical protein
VAARKKKGAGSGTLAADAASQLDVAGLDAGAGGVDPAEVRVLEEADDVGLRRGLEGSDRLGLPAQAGAVVLGDLADEEL